VTALRQRQADAALAAVTGHPGCTVYELTEHIQADPDEGILEVFAPPRPRITCAALLPLLRLLETAGKIRQVPDPAGARWYLP
jgi:hypothetical protein